MVANVQGVSASVFQTMNEAKTVNTYVESAERYQKNHDNSESTTNSIFRPDTEAINDVLQLQHINTYLQFASENPEIEVPVKKDWNSIFAANQRLQQPLEASKLLQRVTAVNTYNMTK